jgi:hypothetical protein
MLQVAFGSMNNANISKNQIFVLHLPFVLGLPIMVRTSIPSDPYRDPMFPLDSELLSASTKTDQIQIFVTIRDSIYDFIVGFISTGLNKKRVTLSSKPMVEPNQRKSPAAVKKRLTIYWKLTEREQLQEVLEDLEVSPYRFVKDCVHHLLELIQAIKREDAPQIWNTFYTMMQKYGHFKLNLNSIFTALRNSVPFDLAVKNPVAALPFQKKHKSRPIPLTVRSNNAPST